MPINILRKDRIAEVQPVEPLPLVLKHFRLLKSTILVSFDLRQYIKNSLNNDQMDEIENSLTRNLRPSKPLNRLEWQALCSNFLKYNAYYNFIHKDPYEIVKRNACLVGQIINATHRELEDLDEYLFVKSGLIQDWSIREHMYDRLIGPNLFKMSHLAFFTKPYFNNQKEAAVSGFLVGPLMTSAMIGLLASSLTGACSPVFFIGFCCLPSLVYLIKGLECIIKATLLALSAEKSPNQNIEIKINCNHAISCFFIATLMPLVWSTTFPLECVRFISRSACTAIQLARSCIDACCIDDHDTSLRSLPA